LPSQGDFSYSPTGFSIFDVDKAIVQLLWQKVSISHTLSLWNSVLVESGFPTKATLCTYMGVPK
jgi:hypothetical protein